MDHPIGKKKAFVPLKTYAVTVTRTIWVIAGGITLIGLGAHLDVPMIPVPMSMQTYAVVVVGALAGWRLAGLTLMAYLLIAAAGAPLFSGGASGIDHLFGPTAGYLFGFVASAMVVGFFAERGLTRDSLWQTTLVMLGGHLITVGMGTLWLGLKMGLMPAIKAGLTPFLLGAVAKSVLAAATIIGLLALWSHKNDPKQGLI